MRTFGIPVSAVLLFVVGGCMKVDVDVPPVNVGAPAGNGESAPRQSPPPSGKGSSGTASASGGSWAEVLGELAGETILGAERNALFYAYDTLAHPKKSVDLAARLRAGKTLQALTDVPIGFFGADREMIAMARTGENGIATANWTPPREGLYRLTAEVLAVPESLGEEYAEIDQSPPAPLLVAAWPEDREIVVIDLDHTVVDSSFARVLLLGNARPMRGSVRVTGRIAKTYGIVYLTHRPDLLTRKSKDFLIRHGYPAGPLLVSTLRQAFGDSGTFKTGRLSALTESFPRVRIGIGDKSSDAASYVRNGLTAYLLPHYDPEDPEQMREIARQIEDLPDGDLHVVSGWDEVEAGIFSDKEFPPREYADYLRRRAVTIERRRRAEEDDD